MKVQTKSSKSSTEAVSRSILDSNFLNLEADISLTEAFTLMSQKPLAAGCTLITQDSVLKGIFTTWDAISLLATHAPVENLNLGNVMIEPVITFPEAKLDNPLAALDLMLTFRIEYLPVVTAQHCLVGLITLASLQHSLQLLNLFKLHQVKDTICCQAIQASASTSALRLAQLMWECEVEYVVIIDAEITPGIVPLGIITAEDLFKLQAEGSDLSAISAQAIVRVPQLTLKLSDSLWFAYEEMLQHQNSHLLVIDEQEQLLGVLSLFNLLQILRAVQCGKSTQYFRQSLQRLEVSKVDLLQNRTSELERLVYIRTTQLEEQFKSDQLLTDITLRIHQSLNLQEILFSTVSETKKLLECDRSIIYRFKPDGSGIVVVESASPNLPVMLGQTILDPCFNRHKLEAYRKDCIQAVADIHNADLHPCYIEMLKQFKIRANLVVPIWCEEELWGLLTVQHCFQPWQWRKWEVSLLEKVGTQLGIAIHQSLLYEQAQQELAERQQAEAELQKANEQLELRVEERTAEWRHVTQQLLVEVAERNCTEKALKEAKEQLHAVLDAVPGLVSWITSDLQYLGVNSHLAAAFNLLPEQFIGQPVGFIDDNAQFTDFLEGFFASDKQTLSQEVSLHTEQGERHYLIVVQKYNHDQAAVSVGMDITDRTQAKLALQESESKFRNLVEQTNDWVWEIDDSLRFVYVSPRIEQITGYTSQETLNRFIFDFMPSDEVIRFTTILYQFTSQQESFSQIETLLRHKDGHEIVLEMSGTPTFNAQNELQGYRGITRDITERKQIERDIRKALTKEKELNELKTRFISMTSHEFRTPLTTIQASAEYLERYHDKLPEERKRASLRRIQVATKQMTDLLSDVLVIGKAAAGKLECQLTPIDLRKFCIDLVEELQLGSVDSNRINFVCTDDFSNVQVDEKLLRHILINLLSNALKYSPVPDVVQFHLSLKDGRASFQVQDQGIGIPVADHKRLFESFHRAVNTGNIPGTGLGLAIVKKAVDAHGGDISFTSKPGEGTTFTVSIPI